MKRTRIVRPGEGNGCGWLVAVAVVAGLVITFFVFRGGNGGNGSGLPFVRPQVPVVVTFRESVWGKGKVAVISNQTAARLTVFVHCRGGVGRPEKSGSVNLLPSGKDEIGWVEGWAFAAGDAIEISHPDYSSKTVSVP